jgi:hypothetical protein
MTFDKYGARHKALRAGWARKVAGGGVLCSRCGWLIVPDEPWDLGHDDHNQYRWTGRSIGVVTGRRRRRGRGRVAGRP